jgi:hypothetical protein
MADQEKGQADNRWLRAEEKAKAWLDSDDHVLPWAETITESVTAAIKHDQVPPLDGLKPSTEPRQVASLTDFILSVQEEAVGALERRVDSLSKIREGARLEREAEVKRMVEDVRSEFQTGKAACDEILRRLGENDG